MGSPWPRSSPRTPRLPTPRSPTLICSSPATEPSPRIEGRLDDLATAGVRTAYDGSGLPEEARHRRPGRLTSARAEWTAPPTRPRTERTVHLRSRGVDAEGRPRTLQLGGSPPLARSGPLGPHEASVKMRFTSARAEWTERFDLALSQKAVHLRSRGVDPGMLRRPRTGCGSPPLARSGRKLLCRARIQRRFTSARAEWTAQLHQFPRRRTVHLRSRGVDRWVRSELRPDDGSPPLARSGLGVVLGLELRERFTSARAEWTSSKKPCHTPHAVHLRSRRVDDQAAPPRRAHGGSPSLAQSGLMVRRRLRAGARFTSARAEWTSACDCQFG